MAKIYYFTNLHHHARDGGTSRDIAFYKFLKPYKEISIVNVLSNSNMHRIMKFVYCTLKLYFLKTKIVIIHQNSILSLFSGELLENKFYRKVIFKLLQRVSILNQLIIEVNDLRYEQALDLDLYIGAGYLDIQKEIFAINKAKFIFASNHMCNYVIKQCGIQKLNTVVIVNGAPDEYNSSSRTIEVIDASRINYVYAGSLNKGRQLKELLQIFTVIPTVNLYLLGTEGEWIKDYNLPSNIHYIGSLPEGEAYNFVARCDMGLIPYDDSKLYYNLCYPTKASFYIAAGIPFLCTELDELKFHFVKSGAVLFAPLSHWQIIINSLSRCSMSSLKVSVEKIKYLYTWSNLLMPLLNLLNIATSD